MESNIHSDGHLVSQQLLGNSHCNEIKLKLKEKQERTKNLTQSVVLFSYDNISS